jgi:hypothetical protein
VRDICGIRAACGLHPPYASSSQRFIPEWSGRILISSRANQVFFEQSGFESGQAFKGAEYGWTLMHEKLAKVLEAMAAPR